MVRFVRASDCDGVLLDYHSTYLEFCAREYGVSHTREELWNENFAEVFEISEEESEERMHKFYRDDLFKKIQPIPGAVEHIRRLAEKDDIVVVTARPTLIDNQTHDSLKNYYGCIKDVLFSKNNFAPGYPGYKVASKSVLCNKIKAISFFEDSARNACDCVDPGRAVYLVNQPWNINEAIVEGVKRINSLAEV